MLVVVVALLFGPGPRPQAVAWPTVFSYGLGVHLRTCSEFYSAQSFGGVVGLAFLSLPSLPVVSVGYRLGLGLCLELGLLLCLIYLLFFHYFST